MSLKNGQVICTSVVPCLSSGLAKNNKIMSMFVHYPWLFCLFESISFSSKMGDKPYTKVGKHDVLVNFFKGITINPKQAGRWYCPPPGFSEITS